MMTIIIIMMTVILLLLLLYCHFILITKQMTQKAITLNKSRSYCLSVKPAGSSPLQPHHQCRSTENHRFPPSEENECYIYPKLSEILRFRTTDGLLYYREGMKNRKKRLFSINFVCKFNVQILLPECIDVRTHRYTTFTV
jgi:hypothetical protein